MNLHSHWNFHLSHHGYVINELQENSQDLEDPVNIRKTPQSLDDRNERV